MTRALEAAASPPPAAPRGAATPSRGEPSPVAVPQGDAPAAVANELVRVRTMWWYGLGALWVIDALLQAQPSMFTAGGMVGNVLLPAMAGQPAWIAGPMTWGLQLWERAPAFWNAAAVVLELAIGGLLLAGPRRASWGRMGLSLSIGWGLVVWFFGEGLGGLFAGSPTYLAGAPGSVALYVVLAGALLLPEAAWSSARMLPALRIGAGALWGALALLQLAPLFWSPLGLASVLQNVAMMPLPLGLGWLDARLVASMAGAPVIWNAVVCVVLFGMALVLVVGRGGTAPYLVALAWLLFVWVVFQGLGMVFSNMSADLNTPPLWALLLVPGWVAARGRPRGRPFLPSHLIGLPKR